MIRLETTSDAAEIKRLLALGFDSGHAGRNIWALREGAPVPGLCLVAEAGDGRLHGSIRYWPISIASTPSLLLGPLAVDPAIRGRGIGRRLVKDSIALAREAGGWRWCFVSGEPGYYTRLGFAKVGAEDLDLPAPIEDERLHLLDFSAKTSEGRLADMPERPWAVRPVQPPS